MDQQAMAKDITSELVTLRDYWRYAISRFNAAGLSFGHGTTTASDDAAFLVLDSLDLPIDTLDPFLDARLTDPERRMLVERIETRVSTRKPSAYITGRSYIQGIRFHVDERVIVPRSHIGEILFAEYLGDDEPTFLPEAESVESVIDVCTGSGCLAVLAAKFFPLAEVDAVDLSADAIEVAKRNVSEHDLEDRLTLYKGNLFSPVAKKKYDLIITNPPYVAHDEMALFPDEYQAEPAMAFDGGEDGLDLVRRLLVEAPKHLTPEGGMLCEIGHGRHILEEEYPDLEFHWIETTEAEDSVFWISASSLGVKSRSK